MKGSINWLCLFFDKQVEVQAFGAFHRGIAEPAYITLAINGINTNVLGGLKIRGVTIGLHAIRSIKTLE